MAKTPGSSHKSPSLPLAKLGEACAMARDLSRFQGVTTRACVGGTPRRDDERALKQKGSQLVAGAVGRVKDLLRSKGGAAALGAEVKLLVLDDADVLLARGFHDELVEILQLLSEAACCDRSQVALVAAGPLELSEALLRDPVKVLPAERHSEAWAAGTAGASGNAGRPRPPCRESEAG